MTPRRAAAAVSTSESMKSEKEGARVGFVREVLKCVVSLYIPFLSRFFFVSFGKFLALVGREGKKKENGNFIYTHGRCWRTPYCPMRRSVPQRVWGRWGHILSPSPMFGFIICALGIIAHRVDSSTQVPSVEYN